MILNPGYYPLSAEDKIGRGKDGYWKRHFFDQDSRWSEKETQLKHVLQPQ